MSGTLPAKFEAKDGLYHILRVDGSPLVVAQRAFPDATYVDARDQATVDLTYRNELQQARAQGLEGKFRMATVQEYAEVVRNASSYLNQKGIPASDKEKVAKPVLTELRKGIFLSDISVLVVQKTIEQRMGSWAPISWAKYDIALVAHLQLERGRAPPTTIEAIKQILNEVKPETESEQGSVYRHPNYPAVTLIRGYMVKEDRDKEVHNKGQLGSDPLVYAAAGDKRLVGILASFIENAVNPPWQIKMPRDEVSMLGFGIYQEIVGDIDKWGKKPFFTLDFSRSAGSSSSAKALMVLDSAIK